jgi:hypothetical protein
MARIKDAIVDVVEQNLDDEIWDRELAEGAHVDPDLLAIAREIAGPDASEHEVRRGGRCLTVMAERWEADYYDGRLERIPADLKAECYRTTGTPGDPTVIRDAYQRTAYQRAAYQGC